MKIKYGWKPDLPDHRDHMFSAPPPEGGVPPLKNLRPLVSHVYDQGDLGSCTANAIGQAMMIGLAIQKAKVVIPSRLFIYYNERVMEHSINDDSGAQIRDGIKSVAVQGACLESSWPYDTSKFAQQPTPGAYSEAKLHQVERYLRLSNSLSGLKNCLAAGYPFVFGISVYDSFESDAVNHSGNVPMPGKEESLLGGHAIICVGYNEGPDLKLVSGQVWPHNTFLFQNSWGTDWGLKGEYAGCATLPFEYLANPNLADDFWTVRLVES